MVRKLFSVALIVLMFLSIISVSYAAEAKKGPYNKLERGIRNVSMGWTELPRTVRQTTKEKGPIFGMTFGVLEGVFNTFSRTVSGIFDTATAPIGTYNEPAVKEIMVEDISKGK